MSSGAPPPPYPGAPFGQQPWPAAAAAVSLADRPLEYHELHLGGRPGSWRGVLGILALGFLVFFLAPVLLMVPFGLWIALSGQDFEAGLTRLTDLGVPTPSGLAFLNLTLAAAIPAAWLVTRVVHGLKPRWLASVLPRIRWGFFAACLGLSVLALAATLLVSMLLPHQGGPEISGHLNEFTPQLRSFALVVLLLTPLQAAGEEYAFRGYLTQACGGLTRRYGDRLSRAVAVVVPALLFAFAHGAQDLPIFIDRFAFGLVAGVLVILTGGLEAGIAMHVLNNFLAFGMALAFSDMASALNPTGGSWWQLPVTLTQSLVYLALAVLLARRMGVATVAEPAVLAASQGPVYRLPPA